MLSVGPLLAGAIMLIFDQTIGTRVLQSEYRGDPILWQHLFWFFGHPEVYVVLLPAMGVVAEIMTHVRAQKAVRLPHGHLYGGPDRRAELLVSGRTTSLSRVSTRAWQTCSRLRRCSSRYRSRSCASSISLPCTAVRSP